MYLFLNHSFAWDSAQMMVGGATSLKEIGKKESLKNLPAKRWYWNSLEDKNKTKQKTPSKTRMRSLKLILILKLNVAS